MSLAYLAEAMYKEKGNIYLALITELPNCTSNVPNPCSLFFLSYSIIPTNAPVPTTALANA